MRQTHKIKCKICNKEKVVPLKYWYSCVQCKINMSFDLITEWTTWEGSFSQEHIRSQKKRHRTE